MANKIATEKKAHEIGGGSPYTSNLMVTRVRAVALGCSIRNTYSNNLLVCLKDLYRIYCDGECNNCTCDSTNCTCDDAHVCSCTSGYCTCNNTCGCETTCVCTTTGCSCNTACTGDTGCTCTTTCSCTDLCACESACSCENNAPKETSCTCHTGYCECDSEAIVTSCWGFHDMEVPNTYETNSTCKSECTSVCVDNLGELLCVTNECSSNTCSGYLNNFNCPTEYLCLGYCDVYCESTCDCNTKCNEYCYDYICNPQCTCTYTECTCTNGNCVCEKECTCETGNCTCQTGNCKCTNQCDCESACDGECANCQPNACVRDGNTPVYECTCYNTCDCTSVCIDCPSDNS